MTFLICAFIASAFLYVYAWPGFRDVPKLREELAKLLAHYRKMGYSQLIQHLGTEHVDSVLGRSGNKYLITLLVTYDSKKTENVRVVASAKGVQVHPYLLSPFKFVADLFSPENFKLLEDAELEMSHGFVVNSYGGIVRERINA